MPVQVKEHNRRPPRKPQSRKTVHVVAHTRPPTRRVQKKAAPAAPKKVYIPKRQPGTPKRPKGYAANQRKQARRGARKADLWWRKLTG